MNTTHTPHQLHPSFLSAPCSGDPLAVLGSPHVIGWENSEQTELTMEPTRKQKNRDPYGSKYIRETPLPFQGRDSTMNHVVASINHHRKYHNIP